MPQGQSGHSSGLNKPLSAIYEWACSAMLHLTGTCHVRVGDGKEGEDGQPRCSLLPIPTPFSPILSATKSIAIFSGDAAVAVPGMGAKLGQLLSNVDGRGGSRAFFLFLRQRSVWARGV